MNAGKNGKPPDAPEADIQHNPADETDECPDAVTEDTENGGNNCIPLQEMSDYQSPHYDATYNHINNGPTKAIITDNTYAHIPNTATAKFDNTYSHVTSPENRREKDTVNELEDSTYNHLSESGLISSASGRSNNRRISVKPDGHKDDTYSHINANNNTAIAQMPNTNEDDTYNHIGDTCVHPPT